MENSRLHQLFKRFDKRDLREFDKFIRSPYHNQHKGMLLLWEFMIECQSHGSRYDIQKAYNIIAPKSTYNDAKMRLLMSNLHELMEQYLAIEHWRNNEFQMQLDRTVAYRQRQIMDAYQRCLERLRKQQTQQKLRHAEFAEQQNILLHEEFLLLTQQQRTLELPMQTISNQMDVAFIARKLRFACTALSHQAVYKADYPIGLLSEILSYVENSAFLSEPAIAVYYYCYKALTTSEESFFKQFKDAILENDECFPDNELRDLYLLATNYCIKCYNEGNAQFMPEGFALYKLALSKNYLLQKGQLSRFTYRNIVTVAIILNEYDWTAEFIEQYKSSLDVQHRDSMYSFNMARLEYARANYKNAMLLLQKADYKDLLLNLAAKTVLLKIYYELQEFSLLEAHLEAMRVFIHRKEFLAYHQENYSNLIRFCRKMMESYYDKATSRETLIREIQATKVVAERRWCLEKLGVS